MIFGRVLFSFWVRCSKSAALQRIRVVNELPLLNQHYSLLTNHYQTANLRVKLYPHRFGNHQALAQSRAAYNMQPACVSYVKDATELASDGCDNDEGDGEESLLGQESADELKDLTEMTSATMEIQETAADAASSAVSSPPELKGKMTKSKMRREKRKLKKKLKSSDNSDDLMAQLPFALTSPTTWKALFAEEASIQKKRKRKRGDSGGRVDSEEDGEKKKKKREGQRPNYFVSIPITNTQISTAVAEVQEAILQQEPRLIKAMIPVPTLHITLLVMHLSNQEQVDLAAAALAQTEPSLAELLGGRDLVLPFSGINHFRKEVVFVSLAAGPHRDTLDRLAELLRSRFEEQGLLQGDCRGFEPHLTIMKLSRASKLRSQGIKRVDPALYSDYMNKFFGDQTVERVDLCSMLKKKQQEGYYHTETTLRLGGRRRSEPDEAELLRVSKRLVEDAVNRALQQYKQEALQNGGGPNTAAGQPPGNTEETATKTDTTANATTDKRK